MTALSPRLSLETLTLGEEPVRADRFGIDKIPAVALLDGGGEWTGIRYFGLPLGFELEAFLEALVNASRGEHSLEEGTAAGLERLRTGVILTVFVTRH